MLNKKSVDDINVKGKKVAFCGLGALLTWAVFLLCLRLTESPFAATFFPVEETDDCDSRLMILIRRRPFETNCPQVAYGQGDVLYKNDGRYKIGFTMLETTGIPAEWVRQCNLMDEVWVPSSFNEKTFRDSGVKVPVHVIPLGVDPNYYSPQIHSYKHHHFPLSHLFTCFILFFRTREALCRRLTL